MIAILCIIVGVFLALGFLLLRSMGRFGQQPTARERMRHNGGNVHHDGPRADGLN